MGNGLYSGVSGAGLSIGGAGHTVNIAGGSDRDGGIRRRPRRIAAALDWWRRDFPQIVVGGTIDAVGGGRQRDGAGHPSKAVPTPPIGSSTAVPSARLARAQARTATAILDQSGTLALVRIAVRSQPPPRCALGDAATAIDLRARAAGAIVRQVAAASGRPAPQISGNILFGSGADTLDVQAGSVLGKLDLAAARTFSALAERRSSAARSRTAAGSA